MVKTKYITAPPATTAAGLNLTKESRLDDDVAAHLKATRWSSAQFAHRDIVREVIAQRNREKAWWQAWR